MGISSTLRQLKSNGVDRKWKTLPVRNIIQGSTLNYLYLLYLCMHKGLQANKANVVNSVRNMETIWFCVVISLLLLQQAQYETNEAMERICSRLEKLDGFICSSSLRMSITLDHWMGV